jgi:hypothetical protein
LRGGRYDSREDRSPTLEPPGTRVFSREIRTVSFLQHFRQPTTIDKYTGETDPRVWLNDYCLVCQLGGATTDEVIIRKLPLHLQIQPKRGSSTCRPARSTTRVTWFARSWGISRARTCISGTPGTCGRAPRSPVSRSETSSSAFPSVVLNSGVAQIEIVHAFLEGTTCQDLLCELEQSSPVDSNELFDIATSFASTARRASAWTMHPRRLASPTNPAEA